MLVGATALETEAALATFSVALMLADAVTFFLVIARTSTLPVPLSIMPNFVAAL